MRSYRIGDLASATGIKVETIRFYERIHLLQKAPARTPGKQRLYSDVELAQLRFIARARQLGFSLAEVRLLLSLSAGDTIPCDDVKGIALRHLETVRAKIDHLRNVGALLSSAVMKCPGGDVRKCAVIDCIEAQL